MTGVQNFSVPAQRGRTKFQAVAGKQRANAEPAGMALAISQMLPRKETAVVIVQPFVEDEPRRSTSAGCFPLTGATRTGIGLSKDFRLRFHFTAATNRLRHQRGIPDIF